MTLSSFRRKIRSTSIIALLIFTLASLQAPAYSAGQPKVGTKCAKAGLKKSLGSKNFLCARSKKRLVWTLAKEIPAPATTVSPVPSQSFTDFSYSRYAGGPGKSELTSLELPPDISVPESGNVRLWIYDPDFPSRSLGSPGIFRKPTNGDWVFIPISQNGAYSGDWPVGDFEVDTVEPNKNPKYERRRYVIRVQENQPAQVLHLRPNSNGVFTLSIDTREPETEFVATNACQLKTNTKDALNVGFPRRADRLPSQGIVRAAIIPISARDLPGNGDPFDLYRPMAQGVHDFFSRMSQGKVSFEFQVLSEWISLGDSARSYDLGSWNGGNPGGYYAAALAAADPYIDFSLFDVVYLMSPTNVPWSYIAYGPAFPKRVMTADGVVKNGTFSGADAYQNVRGAIWKWAAHETGHLFGIYDLYTVLPQVPTYGPWDIMAQNWTVKAIELNSWNRFTQDWLTADQFACLTTATITNEGQQFVLRPVSSDDKGLKSIFVRLSETKVLVIEYRKTSGLDVIPSREEGVLVYTVDMTVESMKGGYQTQRRPGSLDPNFLDALLKPGEVIQVEGLAISVLSSATTATIRVARL